MIKDSIKTIFTSLIVLSLISIASAWTEPASNPPAGNTSAPITNSSTPQAKSGDFGIKGLLRGYNSGALFTGATSTNPSGGACPTGYYWVDGNGNGSKDNEECKIVTLYVGSDDKRVGIGTTTPGSILEIRSRYTSASMLDEILRLSRAGGTYPTIFKQGVDDTDNMLVINNANKDMLSIKNGRVGIGMADPGPDRFSIVSDRDNILNLTRAGGTYPTIFKQGTDDTLVINNGDKDVLTLEDGNVDIAGRIKIRGGFPGSGKVLSSDDSSGFASWKSISTLPVGIRGKFLYYNEDVGWTPYNSPLDDVFRKITYDVGATDCNGSYCYGYIHKDTSIKICRDKGAVTHDPDYENAHGSPTWWENKSNVTTHWWDATNNKWVGDSSWSYKAVKNKISCYTYVDPSTEYKVKNCAWTSDDICSVGKFVAGYVASSDRLYCCGGGY